MKNGWIKLHRVLLDSSIFADAELLRVLIYCILQASYKPMAIPVGRQVITLAPGQLLYGRKAVSNRLGIGENKLRGMMQQLEQLGIIAVESTNRYSIVTMLHWEQYQHEMDKQEFPFDCDFLDEGDDEIIEDTQNHRQERLTETVLEHTFDDFTTNSEPTDNHKQEENNKIKNNKTKELQEKNKEEKKEEENTGAALRAVWRYRRADGEKFPKGEMASGMPDEGHAVPGGVTAVLAENEQATEQVEEQAEEMMFFTEIDMSDFTWDAEDDANWGIDIQTYAEQDNKCIDPDEQEWVAAHQLFNQLWNKYPIKEGKHKVSDAQIMELYAVGKKAMERAIYNYKDKKHRVPRKYWMNGSTFFNGGYLDYLPK